MGLLDGKRIALLSGDGFEDSELLQPLEAVKAAGAMAEVISQEDGNITGKNKSTVPVDKTVNDVAATDYDGLLLPGGVLNPDIMRQNKSAVEFVKEFFESIAVIAVEPVRRADPQKSLPVLYDGGNGVLRQPVVLVEALKRPLRRRIGDLLRPEHSRPRRPQQQERRDQRGRW